MLSVTGCRKRCWCTSIYIVRGEGGSCCSRIFGYKLILHPLFVYDIHTYFKRSLVDYWSEPVHISRVCVCVLASVLVTVGGRAWRGGKGAYLSLSCGKKSWGAVRYEESDVMWECWSAGGVGVLVVSSAVRLGDCLPPY